MTIDQIMRTAPVIPVLVFQEEMDWVALAETFVAAGLPVLEVTLRTGHGLEAIRAMAKVPGAIVGAGTVLNQAQLAQSIEAGSQFIVSPGLSEPLARAALDSRISFLPGVATASEIMRGLDLGLDRFKFFPAEASGGIRAITAIAGPFGNVRFCPTGGIRTETAADWLALPNVLCVGGSWFVKAGDSLETIGERARAAAALARVYRRKQELQRHRDPRRPADLIVLLARVAEAQHLAPLAIATTANHGIHPVLVACVHRVQSLAAMVEVELVRRGIGQRRRQVALKG
jgi:2-dehydro-3-deoxyphosphogluconate aldolase / (4S)-4-hydroxy-2-oxoglutarate aldolase